MRTVLVVANETLGGAALLGAVRRRAEEEETRFVLVVPQSRPKSGLVVYDHAQFDAAQARVDLALAFVHASGLDAIGEVGDPEPYTAAMDAVREYHPSEIIISTFPEARSGWLRRDLIERVRDASGLPVEHIVNDVDGQGFPFGVTLVVANRTAASDELLSALRAKADGDTHGEHARRFIVVVPQERGHGQALARARTRLRLLLDRLRTAELFAAGIVGDPDPYTAAMNAVQVFRVDDIVISTLAATKSGWLRSDLVDRVRRSSGKPVDHIVVSESDVPATA